MFLMLALATAGFCQDGAKKVTRAEALSAVASRVDPEFPPIAKQLHVTGIVELEAVVSEAGSVEKVNILNGNPILTKAAGEALIKWKFKPFTEDGKPVKALAPVQFVFNK